MPVDIPVVRTKTIIPRRRSEILSRPRLLSILNNVLDLKLLILAAPAGYGKTSLLVDFSHHTQVPVCWLALDPLDSDPKRFINHFILSIRSKFPAFGESSYAALSELSQDNVNLDPVISAIVNDAYEHISEHFIFVLDDYHLVKDSKPIEVFINRVIQEVAENFHIIIASRSLLTLPDLSLLVARSQVDGLSFEELAFLPEEIKQLMAVNYHQSITDDKAEEMITLTEGWITGLLLTAQLSPKSNFERNRIEKVSGVGIYEYLTQQVFDRQTKTMQSFLLRTSLLEEFDASLCERIIGKSLGLLGQNWDEVLERIQRDNLFVLPVGDETLFLRYHHLFRDFLQKKMKEDYPEETRKIEIELAAYYESMHEWERAISIYFRIGSTDQIVDMIRKAAHSMILNGRLVTLSDWLNSLPNGLADWKPELMSIRGSIAMLRGDSKISLDLLNGSIEGLRDSGSVEELATTLVRRSAINRHFGKYELALKDALDANELCKPPFGSPFHFAEALRAEGLIYYQMGELNDAQWKLRESYRRYQDLEMESDAAKVLMELGIVYKAQGDLDQTEKCYNDSLEYWQSSRNSLWQANVLNNIGDLQHTRGLFEQAVITFEKALAYARLAANPRVEGYVLVSLGDLYRDLRAVTEARQAYGQAGEILQKTSDLSLDIYNTLAIGILDRITGNFIAALKEISTALEKAKKSGSKYEQYSCLLEKFATQMRMGTDQKNPEEFQKLEDYFRAAGFQQEAFQAAVYRMMSEVLLTEDSDFTALTKLILTNPHGNKHQVLIQIGLENQEIIKKWAETPSVPQAIRDFLKDIEDFNNQIPLFHRVVRRYSSAVQFSHPKLLIRGFGKMQVRLGGKVITGADWRTQVVRDLFFFLVSHPDGVTKEEIGETFWPDADSDTLRLRFKNTIYRMRRAVGKETVSFSDEYYKFNRLIDYDFDVDSFLQEIELARNATEAEEQMEHYRDGLGNYKGSFLPKLDHDWVLILRQKYHQTFMDASLALINLYHKYRRFPQAIAVANRALEEDMFNEMVHRSVMLAYSALDDRPGIARQFEICKNNLLKELDIEPSPQTVKLYNSLMRQ